MTARALNTMLILALPELKEEYQKCVSWQEGDDSSPHIVFECVFVPYIIECVNCGDVSKVKKCSVLIENILEYKDKYSEEVIAFSVFESLIFSEELKEDIYKYLGTESQKVYDEVEMWWKKNSEV